MGDKITNIVQSTFGNGTPKNECFNENPFFMFSKQVKSHDIEPEEIKNHRKKKQLSEVLDSIYNLDDFKPLDEINLKYNCKRWVKSLFSDYPQINVEHIENLLHDFTDSMNTKMKESEMYAVAIMTENKLILCHSRMGEKSINPDWKVFVRMLDKDNIKRYVSFEYDNDVKVMYYENERSKFFIEWLGISEKEAIYKYGGENKFYSEINGYPVSLEIKDEDFDRILEGNDLQIRGNSILLNTSIRELGITHIMRGNKRYKNQNDFVKSYRARKFELSYYSEEYKRLIESLHLIFKKIFDAEDSVSSVCNGFFLKKENDNVEVLFCNGDIDIKDSYLEKFKIALINNEIIRVYHAGMDFKEIPLKIINFEIYNELNVTMSMPLIDYLNEKDCSESFSNDLKYAIFYLLAKDNEYKPIYRFFCSFSNKIADNLDLTSNNINEDSLVELKSKDFLINDNDKLIDKLSKDIIKKMNNSDYKFYILGYSEKIKKYEPFTDNYDDSRLDYLNKGLIESTGFKNLRLFKIKVGLDQCIFMLAVKKESKNFTPIIFNT